MARCTRQSDSKGRIIPPLVWVHCHDCERDVTATCEQEHEDDALDEYTCGECGNSILCDEDGQCWTIAHQEEHAG